MAYSERPWSFLSFSIYGFSFAPMYYQNKLSTMKALSCPDSQKVEFVTVVKISFLTFFITRLIADDCVSDLIISGN
jgi:hypothetical protein